MVVAAVVVAAALFGLPIPSGAVNAAQPTLVSTNPADYTPFIKDDPAVPGADRVNSVTLVSHWVVLGGNFTTVKNYQGGAPLVTRRNIMAFDAATGAISTSFVPAIDGEVLSVRAAGDGEVGLRRRQVPPCQRCGSGRSRQARRGNRRAGHGVQRNHERMGLHAGRPRQPGLRRRLVHHRAWGGTPVPCGG